MNTIPSVLVLSASREKACSLADAIGGKKFAVVNNVEYYQLELENKYYAVRLLMCAIGGLPKHLPREGIEAIVVHYDPKDSQQSLTSYEQLIATLGDPDVLLLACEPFPNPEKRDETTEWCHVNKFELVDMVKPQENLDDPEEAMAKETFGIERVIEVLNTHTWPNRVHKVFAGALGFNARRRRIEHEEHLIGVDHHLANLDLNSEGRNPTNRFDLDRLLGEKMRI